MTPSLRVDDNPDDSHPKISENEEEILEAGEAESEDEKDEIRQDLLRSLMEGNGAEGRKRKRGRSAWQRLG